MKRRKHSYMLMINDMMAVERTLSAKRQFNAKFNAVVNLISTQMDPFWVRGVPKLRARVVHVCLITSCENDSSFFVSRFIFESEL